MRKGRLFKRKEGAIEDARGHIHPWQTRKSQKEDPVPGKNSPPFYLEKGKNPRRLLRILPAPTQGGISPQEEKNVSDSSKSGQGQCAMKKKRTTFFSFWHREGKEKTKKKAP